MLSNSHTIGLVVSLAAIATTLQFRSVAQTGLPDIYAETPVAVVPSETIAAFPVNTFLENLVVAPTSDLWITNHEVGELVQISPDRSITSCLTLEGKVTGIALVNADTVIVNGWNAEGVPFVAAITGMCTEATVSFLQTVPEAMFLNGITPLSATEFLMTDSYRGAIWLFDLEAQTTRVWLEHPLLARSDPDSSFPAANGIKRFGDFIYVSNTQQMLLVRIPLDESLMPSEPEIVLEGTNIDDFAFDQDGTIYAATHVYNSIIKVLATGETESVATAEQGVVGSTAVAFGQTEQDQTTLYVVTNGGMFLPPATGIEPGRVIALDVGVEGAALLP